MEDEFWSPATVSAKTTISEGTLGYWRHVGGIGPKHFKLGKRVLYARADVEEWIAEARAKAEAVDA